MIMEKTDPKDHPFNQPGRKPLREFNRVGVTLDSYKVKRFREVLAKNGFDTKLKRGLSKNVPILVIDGVHIDKLEELRTILVRLELEFKNRN